MRQLLTTILIAVGRPDLAMRLQKDASYARALSNERSRILEAPVTRDVAYDGARRRLEGPESLTFGTLRNGDTVRVRRPLALMSALVLGATGAGKTRFLLSLLMQPLWQTIAALRADPHAPREVSVELELIDPKFETFDLFRKYIAALWLTANDAGRELLQRSVRVIDWSRDRVTPLAPFDNFFADISNAYLAHLRTDVTVRASGHAYTDSMRQLAYMFNWLLVELRFPPSYRFAVKFMHDPAFRAEILARVPEPEVRYYFENFDTTVPRQTRDAFLRRVQYGTSFPELRASYVPPAALDRLGLLREAPITLVNTACTTTLPKALGVERGAWRTMDVLCAAPRRDPRRPKSLVIDEALEFMGDPDAEHTEALATGLRTLRSVNMGTVLLGQDVSNALPSTVLRNILLNTTWVAGFRAREDAQIFWPHVVHDPADRRTDAARRDAFSRDMAGMARQHYLLLVKGEPALPLRAPDVTDPAVLAGVSDDALLDTFNREIAVRSMLPNATALKLIEEWEADVVEKAAIPPAPKKPKGTIKSIVDLKKFLMPGKDDK
ncbi:MAG: hypothetical protein QOC81_495 [Thermoanaerobaculia bacterium]|nr:hypothetical protein [Thermoanaerobaculia bacterium]